MSWLINWSISLLNAFRQVRVLNSTSSTSVITNIPALNLLVMRRNSELIEFVMCFSFVNTSVDGFKGVFKGVDTVPFYVRFITVRVLKMISYLIVL